MTKDQPLRCWLIHLAHYLSAESHLLSTRVSIVLWVKIVVRNHFECMRECLMLGGSNLLEG